MAKIEDIALKETKKGKEFYKIKADGRNYSVFDTSKAFKQLKNKEIKMGGNYKINYTETAGEFNGEAVTYKNAIDFVPLGAAKEGESSASSAPDWDGKERRIVRENCLGNAIGFFGLNKEIIAMNKKVSEKIEEGATEEMVLKVAEKFENWIYRPSKKILPKLEDLPPGPGADPEEGEEESEEPDAY